MKIIQSKLLVITMSIFVLGACNQEDDKPFIDPLIGEWTAHEEQFLTISVNGEEKSMQEFGMEILNYTEEEATMSSKAYFQRYYLGPIDIKEPKILFSDAGKLNATLAGQPVEGNWEIINERRILYLRSAGLHENIYPYYLKKLTANELVLDWHWEMTVFYDESISTYDVIMEIRMVK